MTTEQNIALQKPCYFLNEKGVKFAVYTEGQLKDIQGKNYTEVDEKHEANPAIKPPAEEMRIG